MYPLYITTQAHPCVHVHMPLHTPPCDALYLCLHVPVYVYVRALHTTERRMSGMPGCTELRTPHAACVPLCTPTLFFAAVLSCAFL